MKRADFQNESLRQAFYQKLDGQLVKQHTTRMILLEYATSEKDTEKK